MSIGKRAILETYGKVTEYANEWRLRRNAGEGEWNDLIYGSLEELYMDIYTVMLYRVKDAEDE